MNYNDPTWWATATNEQFAAAAAAAPTKAPVYAAGRLTDEQLTAAVAADPQAR